MSKTSPWKVFYKEGDVRRTRLKNKGNSGRETQNVPPGNMHDGFKDLDAGSGRDGGQSMYWAHNLTVSACGHPKASTSWSSCTQPPKDYRCDLCDGAKIPQLLV